jgi:hypothetical protein
MKVFISWSGSLSKRLGEALRDWLPGVLQVVKPYFTPSDIEKGTRWAVDIAQELDASQVGILCITRDNLHSDWVLFEAGALSKSLDKAHVCPVLFGIKSTDLAGPLKQFQATEFTKTDFHKLLTVINGRLGDSKLSAKTLDTVFEKWWPELEQQIEELLTDEGAESAEPVRSERELLVEVLELSRTMAKRSNRPGVGISTKAIMELLKEFMILHHEQANEEGTYQDTLDGLKKMQAALQHIAQRYKGYSEEIDDIIEAFGLLTYKVKGSKPPADPDEEDIPF